MVPPPFARESVAQDGLQMEPISAVTVNAVIRVWSPTAVPKSKHLLIAIGPVRQRFVMVVAASLATKLSW